MVAATFWGLIGGDSSLAEPFRQAGRRNAVGEIDYERSMGGAGCLSVTRGSMDICRLGMRSVRVLFHHKSTSSYADAHGHIYALSFAFPEPYFHPNAGAE